MSDNIFVIKILLIICLSVLVVNFINQNKKKDMIENFSYNIYKSNNKQNGNYNSNKEAFADYEETIIEQSIRDFSNNQGNQENFTSGKSEYLKKLLLCNMIPTMKDSDCMVDGKPLIKYLFPVHLFQLPSGNILAVFNDGRLYEKTSILSNMWKGPLKNSMPYNVIPLRMVTISYKDNDFLGIGYDNKLYAKKADKEGNLNILGEWKVVPNNNGIIFCMTDPISKNLIVIDKFGQIYIKTDKDLTSALRPYGDISEPIFKLHLDSNGYMLAIDTNFNLVQFTTKDWQRSKLNYDKGVNKQKVFDIMYDSDGKLFGLILVPSIGVLELMKQQEIYYLSDFVPLEFHTKETLQDKPTFNMNINETIKLKTGIDFIQDNKFDNVDGASEDDDIRFAYYKSMMADKKKLRKFCQERGVGAENRYDNFELLNNIQAQERQIEDLNQTIRNLLKYEPEGQKLQESIDMIR
tara:strand:+ start:1577 stop:2968 length:1392 start_codon:yes stop_codon:yes gene_type:complete